MTDIAEEPHYETVDKGEADLSSLHDYDDLLQDNNPAGINEYVEIIS